MKRIYSYFIFCILTFFAVSCKKNTENTLLIKNKIFVVLGSSTAFGTGASSVDSSWVGLLAAKFISDKKEIKVVNLAAGGYTTYQILSANTVNTILRPNADNSKNVTAALTYQPDFIIISLPSNDIAANYSDSEILENYKKITNEIIKNKVRFIITSTQPRNFTEKDQRKRLQLFNTKLETAYPFNVVDYYIELTDDSYYIKQALSYGDGIHLNNQGHKVIFDALFKNKLFLQKAGY